METKTVREEWKDRDGKVSGFNIRFKGGCTFAVNFEYVCLSCDEHVILQHKRSDPMKGRQCIKCSGELSRYHDKPPSLDADFHESCLTHNIGWDENGG